MLASILPLPTATDADTLAAWVREHLDIPLSTGEACEPLVLPAHIVFSCLDYDQSGNPNPLEDWDGMGTLLSFNRDHTTFRDPEQAMAAHGDDPDTIPLSYFEHGQSLWMVQELPTPPGVEFRWDGVRFAGLWVPCASTTKEADDLGLTTGSPERRAWMVERAKHACETYTDWANGYIYAYRVAAYPHLRDDAGDVATEWEAYDAMIHRPVAEDSLSGIYGWEYAQDELRSAVGMMVTACVEAGATPPEATE